MELRLYDTLTREKRVFAPLDPGNVRMYVCGPTVYDFAHIGNARPVIVFDVLFRLLRHIYGADHVTYVRNITDVDDKINARAAAEYPDLPLNEAIRKVTEKTERQFHEDVAALGCLPPTVEPRATEHIAEMQKLITALLDQGHAYQAGGEVLFDVDTMPAYGQLSGRNLEENLAGARVSVDAHKKNPGDFVLWKLSSPEEPGWDSPWGHGRPGWHIECSAMADKWLWTEAKANLSEQGLAHPHQFDIHGGGIDLVFPHHENEIAQTRCAFHSKVMANFWMHNGFLQVEGEKMSKSLGNFVTIRELLGRRAFGGKKWSGNVVRLAMLRTHYQKPIDWTVRALEESAGTLAKWKSAIAGFDSRDVDASPLDEVLQALTDDLNTPNAVQIIDRFAFGVYAKKEKARLVASLELIGLFSRFRVQLSQFRRGLTQFLNELDTPKFDGSELNETLVEDVESSDRFDDLLLLALAKKRLNALSSVSGGREFDEFASYIAPSVTASQLKDLGDQKIKFITRQLKARLTAKD